ncbi:putative E3 ubiquitin-protein ligase UBR7 [Gigantopelta aegis]|uniref:putative E3 ubiquitin-protein ligase UBR7 n=1 Tax=Gigantopelta aegis TaxID=1735272 RepID=UPI001B888486|nr:putative E3 ubiquitin-protein ligase UBR7 [Gigantopelta aegis]
MSDNVSSNANTSEEDPGVSMIDILAEEERLTADAHAVLGDSDDKNCTYSRGYVNRQALYACQTCSSEDSGPAGVCLACSYECHEGHELVELYTKRNFRCDCGNIKFPGFKCKLYEFKDEVNTKNQYNQNFKGLYCTCHRPYPDEENDVEDEMIQCIICEDWFHGLHLECPPLDNYDFDEMVCSTCMKKLDFLWAYTVSSTATTLKTENGHDICVDVGETSENIDIPSNNRGDEEKSQNVTAGAEVATSEEEIPSTTEETSVCKLEELQKREITVPDTNAFWPKGFRSKLCRCPQCIGMYENKGVSFLLDVSDTVHAYEERGRLKAGPASRDAQEIEALSQMNRVQQVEVILGYNDLKSELNNYLKKFAENGKIVREEDIREFFEDLNARKRRKVGSGVQYLCK